MTVPGASTSSESSKRENDAIRDLLLEANLAGEIGS
jgi:hypothetical protein